MEPQIQYVKTSDGVSIACSMLGDGTPLVYASNVLGDLHWYTHNEETRAEVDALVAAGWCVVRYDGRGMGSSDRAVTDLSLDARVLDLEAVVDHLAIERFALCGWVHGGAPAIVYSLRHPERVSHLILVNAYAAGAAYYAKLPVARLVFELRAMAEEEWAFFTLTLASAMARHNDPARAERTAALFRSAISPGTYVAFAEEARTIDLTGVLRDVSVPTLVLIEGSGGGNNDLSRALAAGVPGARLVATDHHVQEISLLARTEAPAMASPAAVQPYPSGTAVILFADIVDSTALTERMGDAAFRTQARDLDTAMRSAIRECGGAPVEGKLLGDGVLAVFTSAREAIDAALRCATAGDAGGLPLHLGIHAGDVIREEDNVYGGAVNIASRISALSAPNELLVSDTVRSLARTSAGVRFEDRGEHALKGVADAQRVFAVTRE